MEDQLHEDFTRDRAKKTQTRSYSLHLTSWRSNYCKM